MWDKWSAWHRHHQAFWQQGLVSWKTILHTLWWRWGVVWGWFKYTYCGLYFYYYYIVTYNEIITQLTIMQNQWGEPPGLAFLSLDGPTGGEGRQWWRECVMGSGCKDRWKSAHSPAAHLPLRGLAPNRPRIGTCLSPREWGSLVWKK